MTRYVRVGDMFVRVDVNPLLLGWRLWTRGRSFRFSLSSRYRLLSTIPGRWLRPVRIIKLACVAFMRSRVMRNLGRGDVLDLDEPGDLAIPRRPSGHKVFDLAAQTVTTVGTGARPADSPVVPGLLERLHEIGVAPQYAVSRPSSYRLREAYVNEPSLLPSHLDPETLDCGVSHITLQLLNGVALSRVRADEYYRNLADRVRGYVQAPGARGGGGVLRDSIESLLDGTGRDWNGVLTLVASHGDLTEKNLFRQRTGFVAIDWETFSHRTLLYDVWTHYFSTIARFGGGDDDSDWSMMKRLQPVLRRVLERVLVTARGRIGSSAFCTHAQSPLLCPHPLYGLELVSVRFDHFISPVHASSPAEAERRAAQLLRYFRVIRTWEARCHEVR